MALEEYRKQIANLSVNDQRLRDLYLRRLALGEIQGPSTGYASIDRPWLKSYDEEVLTEIVPDMSIYQYAYDSNKNNMKNVAFDIRMSKNDFGKGIKITYGAFFEKIRQIAKSLKAYGIKSDMIIPLIVPNLPEARELIYANSYNGSVSYPISPLLPSEQLRNIIDDNNIRMIFVFDLFYDKYREVLENSNLEKIVMLDGTESLPFLLKAFMKFKSKKEKIQNDKVISWDDFIKNGKKVNLGEPYYCKNHVTAIIGTSGTTGTPKGVCLTDMNINSVGLAYKNGRYFDGTFMDALIPSIGYGISMIHYQTVDGRYVYLIPELLTTKFPRAFEKIKPSNFPGGPVHSINLLEQNGIKKYDFSLNLISGGASLPKNVESSLNGVSEGYAENGKINDDIVVRQGYGLSENTAMGSYNKRGSYKFGSIGIPIIYENVGIFDPETERELPYNTPGEICISSDSAMKEYLNNPEETKKVISYHDDGTRWIRTKDIGYIDEDGNIFHVDRIKNIFMRCGFNIHPNKIAEFLDSLDIVKQSVVIGFDHPLEQAVPVAFVVLDKEKTKMFTDNDAKELLNDICYKNLEETSVPYEYVFVDELPLNAGGKIDLPLLKKNSGINYMVKDNIKKKII